MYCTQREERTENQFDLWGLNVQSCFSFSMNTKNAYLFQRGFTY